VEAAQVSPSKAKPSAGEVPGAPKPVARQGSGRLPLSAKLARSLGPLRPRPGTIVTLSLAVAAVALTWADPFAKDDAAVLLVNNRSGGRRVFPTLVDADPSRATIELQAPGRPLVRIIPAPDGGHQLMRDDVLLGPVAIDDFDGLWSSLRLATATRKTNSREGLGLGTRGVIRISLPDSNLTLALGEPTSGGGVYAAFAGAGEAWVVEAELLGLVEQATETWLSARLLPLDPEFVTGLAWGDELALRRGADGFWRVRAGGPPGLLSTDAVELRLRRLLRAKLDPFVDRDAVASESLRPWLVVTTLDGGSRALLVGGECPDHPERRLVDRGPGLLGCVPASLLERWPLHDPDAAMLETRLVPHDYARIVGLGLEAPVQRSLVRRGGEWFYAEGGEDGEDRGLVPVAEAEVRRWYQAVGRLEVALAEQALVADPGPESAPPGFTPDWTLVVHADTDELVRVSCRIGREPAVCVRDGGPQLRVLGEIPRNLVFEVETFAERRLTNIGAGEIRSLEILPPDTAAAQSGTVRQSVHADMGVWELDAPQHPDDSGAVDQDGLETVLWALRQLRAEAWVEAPIGAPRRRLIVDVVPAQGLHRSVSVTLYDGCVVEVDEHPPAAIAAAQCEALGRDLLFDDPLRFWLERSRGVEVGRIGEDARVFLRRRDEQFVSDDGRALDEALVDQLRAWIDWRSAGLRDGDPPTPARWTLDVRREFGPPAQVEIGAGWARLRGASWYYVQRDPSASPTKPSLPIEPEPEPDLD
jgi:hypothetical protein